ncbi:hypothetical protein [Cyclobacterium xiamenense]|uniref:hypothetical protein n=1 Tax=Cyclobacterium xiamenense TaxID=1297121 RepID=UPI0035D1115E
MKCFVYLILLALASSVLSCEEAESRYSDSESTIVGPTGILENIKKTNLSDEGFPWYSLQTYGIYDLIKLKSWNITKDGLIPVKTGGYVLAEQALDTIEKEVGKKLFDRASIANTPDTDIKRGIIVSRGTALGQFGSTTDPNGCGHVSQGVGTTSYPLPTFTITEQATSGEVLDYVLTDGFYDATGTINTVLYVHIGAAACANEINVDMVIHEFGHALGMGAHFDGFGIGPAIDGNFWNTLHTIYNNPTGTTEDDLVIYQVKY